MEHKKIFGGIMIGLVASFLTACTNAAVTTELSERCTHPESARMQIDKKAPTCKVDGLITYECVKCNEELTEVIPHGEEYHKVVASEDADVMEKTYQAKKAAKCGESYIVYGKCKYCNEIQQLSTDSTPPHSFVNKTVYNMKDEDSHTYVAGSYCEACGTWDKLNGYIEKEENHDRKGGCTNNAVLALQNNVCKYYECICSCGYKFILKQEHSWNNGTTIEEATCSTPRVVEFTCKNPDCKVTKTEDIDRYLPHDLGEGVITKEPTCSETGIESFVCKACNQQVDREIARTILEFQYIGDIQVEGLAGKLTLPNAQSLFDFDAHIAVPDGAEYVVSRDFDGTDVLNSHTVPLEQGNNTFYIIASNEDKSAVKKIMVTLHRIPVYTVSFDTKGGTPVESFTVEENESFDDIYTTSKAGATFLEWLVDGQSISYPYTPVKDVTLVAKYQGMQYIVKLNAGEGTCDMAESYTATMGEALILPKVTYSSDSEKFRGWSYNDTIISDMNGVIQEWNIPSNAVLKAVSIKEGSTMTIGRYPQDKVTDGNLVASLNTLAGELPTEFDLFKWKDYGYYADGIQEAYSYYIDIDVNEDGAYDYRGVYFTKYRPDSTTSSHPEASSANQYASRFQVNQVYWFKFQDIQWKVTEIGSNYILLSATTILDCQHFYRNAKTDLFDHNGDVGYANDYRLSDVRKWLTTEFFNTAFSKEEQGMTTNQISWKSGYEAVYDPVKLPVSVTPAISSSSEYSRCMGYSSKSTSYSNGYSKWNMSRISGKNAMDYMGVGYSETVDCMDGILPQLVLAI